jgi:pyruvate/2-oxoglutarate dehydrogenase complex dihydrolipoamide acyltransferase (E2) component
MAELVTQVADAVGIETDVASQAIGYMLAFLRKEGDEVAVEKMIAAIPGATELADGASSGGGGIFGALLGGGIMGLGQKLMSLGLGMGEITALAKQTMAVARQYAGDDTVDAVIASVPGLSQFV